MQNGGNNGTKIRRGAIRWLKRALQQVEGFVSCKLTCMLISITNKIINKKERKEARLTFFYYRH